MRVGVWFSAAAVVLFTVASGLRTAQVEGVPRVGRRLSSPSTIEDNSVANPSQSETQTTFKSRSSRRREETTERDVVRSRIRSRPTEAISETPPLQGERFDSRRTSSRTRSRPADNEIKTEQMTSRENIVQSRTRQINRRPSQTTQIPLETSSPTIDVTKLEIINSNLNDISRIAPKEDNTITTQFRRRSSSAPIIISTSSTESINPRRPRGRINTRNNLRTPDLDSSGTTNSISVSDKEPTTARTGDLRNGRNLRYRNRQSETDTNLTGDGLTKSNEIVKSSQSRKKTSQQEIQTFTPIVERLISQSTEANKLKTTTLKITKVIRRPIGRGKVSKPPISKTQATEEINDDDNYPPSFKALIQAKNASTQASSPIRESLSVKASQKVYNTYTPSVQSTQTGPAENKYSRLRKQKVDVEKEENKTVEKVNETTMSPETSKPKTSEYRPRGSYSTRNKKSTVFAPSTTTSPFTNQSSGKINKYNRKFKVSTTESSTSDNIDKNKQSEGNLLNKPFVRPPIYTRKLVTKNMTSSETSIVTNSTNNSTQSKITLPRTSYYSRLRTNLKSNETSTTEVLSVKNNAEAQKKIENTVDMPLIFTLLKNPDDAVSGKDFIVNVNSKELQDRNTINEESENMKMIAVSSTMSSRIDVDRHKYHANYKDQNPKDVQSKERTSSTVIPPVRNIQTRKYGRKYTKSKNLNEENGNLTSPKPRERNIRKFSDVYSKTTEASSNGIAPEPERPKSRFSSKYRASNVDTPYYKPTVPTITSSTVEGEEIQLGPDMNAISFTQTRRTLSSADLRLSESLVKQSHVMNVEASQHSPSVTVSIFDALADILTSTPRTGLSSTTEVTNKPILNTDVTQMLNGVSNINVNSAQGITNQKKITVVDSDVSTITKSVQNIDQTTPNVINSTVGADVTPLLNTQDVNVTPVNTPRTPIPIPTTPVSARRPFAIKLLYSDTEPPTYQPTTAFESTSDQPTTDSTMVYNTVSDLLLSNNNLLSSELTSMLSNNIKKIIQNMDKDSRSKIYGDMAKLLNTIIPKALDRLPTAFENSDIIPNTTPYSLEDIKDTENIDISEDSVNTDSLQNVVVSNIVNSTNKNGRLLILPTDFSTEAVNSSEITLKATPSSQPTSSSQTTLADAIITTISSQLSSVPSIVTSTSSTIQAITSSASLDAGTIGIAIDTENRSGLDVSIDSTNNISPLPFLTNYQINDLSPEVPDSDQKSIDLAKSSVGSLFDDINIDDPSQLSRVQLWVLSKKARVLKMIEDLIRQHNNELATAPTLTNISPLGNVNLSERLTNIMNTMISTTESILTNDDISESSTTSPMSTITTPTFPLTKVSSPMTTTISSVTVPTTSIITPISDVISFTTESLLVEGITINNNDASLSTEFISKYIDNSQSPISSRFGSLIEETTVTTDTQTTSMTTLIDDSSSTQSLTTITSSRVGSEIEESNERSDTVTLTTSAVEFTNAVEMNTEISTAEQENLNRLLDDPSTPTTVAEIEQTTTPVNTDTTTVQAGSETTTQINLDTTTQNDTEVTTQVNTTTVTTDSDINQSTTPLSILRAATPTIPKKDYVIFGILPNNTVVRKDPNDDVLETLTEASPYIVYGVLPNNTIIRKFPNGTRVPRVMQKIDVLPISPWSLRNPYSPIHNNPAIVRPQPNPIRVSTNTVTFTDTSNNGKENSLTSDTVNNLQPMTKQIRTEKPDDGGGNAIFKFIPIDEVTVSSQNSNVLKLASTRIPTTTNTEKSEVQIVTATSVTESNTQTQQIQTQGSTDASTTTIQSTVGSKLDATFESTTINVPMVATEIMSTVPVVTTSNPTTTTLGTTTSTSAITTTIAAPTLTTTTQAPTTTTVVTTTTTTAMPTISTPTTTKTEASTTTHAPSTTTTPAPIITTIPTTPITMTTTPLSTISPLFTSTSTPIFTTAQTTTISIEEDLKKYQEDLQLLQTLLQATGRDPKNLNLRNNPNLLVSSETTTLSSPTTKVAVTSQSIDQAQLLQALLSTTIQKPNTLSVPNTGINNAQTTTVRSIVDDIRQFEEDTKLLKALLQATGQNPSSLNIPTINNIRTTTIETPTTTTPTTTPTPTTTFKQTTTQTIAEDIKQLEEDAKFLQALLKAAGQKTGDLNLPVVSGVTSNIRIASNPQTTSIMSNPTTPIEVRPVYTTTTQVPVFKTFAPRTVSPTLQPAVAFSTVTEGMGISTTFAPISGGMTTTFRNFGSTTVPSTRLDPYPKFTVTTDIPSTSTFSVQEDLAFLNNLKNVLNITPQNQDPEAALANRVIALAVEKSLKEIQSGTQSNSVRTGKTIADSANNIIATTTTSRPITTTTTTTSTTTTTPRPTTTTTTIRPITTTMLNGPSIEDDIRQFQEDTKLLQALIKATGQDPSQFNIPTLPNIQTGLNGKQETTTQKSKLITGQTSDEALQKLILQTKPTGMISEATIAPISLSTEYGKSNDALLAALLKEQGFGPTTASSLDEQLRLAIPLEPPRAVVTEQAPGRGQLVSAAINVTRAFSQFLGAAIQGAAQTVQSVIRAGQKVATDVYTNGSGGSG